MYDAFHIDQFNILYKLDEWYTYRRSQNIFLNYRSWSGIFQTLSMFIHQSNLENNEVLFLTPIQIEAVMISRSGMWAEPFAEYIYESFSVDPDLSVIVGKDFDFLNMHKIREAPLYRIKDQPRPKLVVILHGELLNPRMLRDCNEYLHIQTLVCFDSAMFYASDSIVNSVGKCIDHTFLNEESPYIQQFLYQCLEKRLIPLSKDKSVRVYEYNGRGVDLNKMIQPVVSATEEHPPAKWKRALKGSLIYTTEPNWRYSLEDNRYYLNKGIYLVVDAVSRKDGKQCLTMHPTYTKYKFKSVPDAHYRVMYNPTMIENLPQWAFSHGTILSPKVLSSLVDAARLYNAVNLFTDHIDIYVL